MSVRDGFVLDDAMYDLIRVVPSWLDRWSLTEGWIGFARERPMLRIDPAQWRRLEEIRDNLLGRRNRVRAR